MANMGIASTSFAGAVLGERANQLSSRLLAPARDTLQFLEQCHGYGAAGIQAQVNGDPSRLRARAEELGMWIEAMISVGNGDPQLIEKEILNAKAAGCTVARDGLLNGRRYESFNSSAEWKAWVDRSHHALRRAVPLLEKHQFTLALENHKDWTLDEYLQLFKTYESEYFGSCLDFGNNISLLDDPMTVIEAVAPLVKATHFKDIAVASCDDGFLLAEVVLGTGCLDLEKIADLLLEANPKLRFSLEMITRDPLPVPCLTDQYWTAFPDRSGVYLARTQRFVAEQQSSTPLPLVNGLAPAERARIEEENVTACFRYAAEKQLFAIRRT